MARISMASAAMAVGRMRGSDDGRATLGGLAVYG